MLLIGRLDGRLLVLPLPLSAPLELLNSTQASTLSIDLVLLSARELNSVLLYFLNRDRLKYFYQLLEINLIDTIFISNIFIAFCFHAT